MARFLMDVGNSSLIGLCQSCPLSARSWRQASVELPASQNGNAWGRPHLSGLSQSWLVSEIEHSSSYTVQHPRTG